MNKNDKLVKGISQYSKQIGGFAARHGNLISSCDGVGTKILLAQQAKEKYLEVGKQLTVTHQEWQTRDGMYIPKSSMNGIDALKLFQKDEETEGVE